VTIKLWGKHPQGGAKSLSI